MTEKGTILVVDDTPANLKLLVDTLTAEGYQVLPADSGELALTAVAARSPELILLDIRMPGLNGLEVCRRLKARAESRDIPIMFISAFEENAERVEGFKLGAVDFISKPIQAEELLARVQTHLELRRLGVRLEQQTDDLRRANEQLQVELAERQRSEAALVVFNQEMQASHSAVLNLMDDAVEARIRLETANQELRREIVERKQAEEALRASEERLRRAVLDSPFPILLHAEDGAILQVSNSWCEITGYTREELATIADWTERAYGERKTLVQADIDRLYRLDHRIAEGDYLIRIKSGGTRIWEFSSAPVGRLPDGRRLVISMAMDVTERRQAEKTLIALSSRQEAILAAVPDIIMEVDSHKVYTWANQAGLAFFGDDVIGKEAAFYFVGEQSTYQTVQPLFSGCEELIYVESWQRRKDGEKRLLAWWCRVLKDENSNVTGTLSSARDITERKQAEEANARLATGVEQAAEAIVITDAEATILYVNPAFEKITGYTRQESVGRNPRLLQSGKHDAAFYRQMWDTLARGEVWKGHMINKKKSGAFYNEEATISPVRDAAGRIVNYVAVKRDVTQEMVLETQLRQSQKMDAIGQLASGVAHDFNNILTIIHGNATLQFTADLNPVERGECTQQIIQAAERAASLTRQLLLFSRKQVMQPASLDLNEVVGGMIKMLKRILGEDITLCSEMAPALPFVYADAGMLEQVLLNLAVNSRDAMPAGGRLTISTGIQTLDEEQARQNPESAPGRHFFLEVADTGSGIPPEVLPQIFEPFFTTKEAGKGTGLGLATVHGIVKQHHGWITVQSEVDKGTAFRIYLPAIKDQAGSAKAPAASRLPGGRETILLVEDELPLRLLVGNVLQRCGYTVIRAESGVVALKLWQECNQPVHLLLTDLVMPDGISGFDLASRLQAEKPELKVIFMSGYSAKAGKGPPLVEGENFLQKPFPPQKLAQTVRDCLDRKTSGA